MSALALLDPPAPGTNTDADADAALSQSVVFTGLVLGCAVVIVADRPAPVAPLDHLLTQLNEQWDVRRRRSDLGRVSNRPNVMVAVSPVTLLLVGKAGQALRLWQQVGMAPAGGQAVLDVHHGRVGLDPVAAAIAIRLAPAVAVDVLVGFCLSSGLHAGQVRIGETVRGFSDDAPAWLQQVARDCGRSTA